MLGVVIWYVHGSKGGHIIIIGTRYCGHVIIQCVAVILGGCAVCIGVVCIIGWNNANYA
jgi:hypothetical protein